jgi:hypothetical protein
MRLSSYEKETIINFNEAEAEASIFTYNKAWQRHLEQKLGLKPTMDNGYGGKEYQIDKKRIPMPRAPRQLSLEAKARLVKRLADARYNAHVSAKTAIPVAKSAAKRRIQG